MNDEQLMAAVRESLTDMHLSTPVEQIASRGRAVRARRRIPGVAGALATVAAAALALTALLPASHQPATQLAAWTVAEHPDGSLYVTIRQLRDPAGLQSRLRADGVPASVTFTDHQNPSCRAYVGRPGLANRVISPATGNGQRATVLVIHPSALPHRAGVMISASHVQHPSQGGIAIGLMMGPVHASHRCTGS